VQYKNPVSELSKWGALLTALVAGLLTSGCEDGHGKQAAQAPIPEVATLTVATQRVVLTTELPGRTSAFRIAEIRPQVNGLILKRLFTEGADVRAGEVLYQIDPAPFQATLDNAKAALERAEANLPAIRLRATRYRELLADKAVSQQDYDDAAASMKQAEADIQYYKASVATARINLGYTRILAPISGRIGRSSVTDGALVTAYQPLALATIQQLDPIYVDVPQSTAELQRLRSRLEDGRLDQNGKNQKKVKLILEDDRPYPLEGTFQFREVSVDPTTGTVILRVMVPNPEAALLPGMFVRAVLREGTSENAVLVPQQAVARDPKGNPFALAVDADGRATQRMLVLDRAIRDQWLVASGLEAGDRVIVEGMQRVRPGAAVKAVPFEPVSGPPVGKTPAGAK
jgi:membrane fusion protein (multidrug efflux system)